MLTSETAYLEAGDFNEKAQALADEMNCSRCRRLRRKARLALAGIVAIAALLALTGATMFAPS